MKKSFAIGLALLLISILSLPVIADTGVFTESPTGMKAPELIEYSTSDEDCTAVIHICAYGDRAILDAEAKAALETAYESVLNAKHTTDLNKELAAKVKKLRIPRDKLAVSDLFDIYYTRCDDYNGHGDITITIKPATTENFMGLLHYSGGEWALSDCSEQDGTLTFTVSELSPFAIVLHEDFAVTPTALHAGFVIALIVVLIVVIIIIVISP